MDLDNEVLEMADRTDIARGALLFVLLMVALTFASAYLGAHGLDFTGWALGHPALVVAP